MRTVSLNHFETGLKKIYVKEGNAQIRFQRLSFLVASLLLKKDGKAQRTVLYQLLISLILLQDAALTLRGGQEAGKAPSRRSGVRGP